MHTSIGPRCPIASPALCRNPRHCRTADAPLITDTHPCAPRDPQVTLSLGMDRASQYLVFVASVLAAVQNGAVLEMTGDAAKIEFGGGLTLSHNTSEDQLTCSGKIKATDVLIEGTSTTVADLIGEVAVLRQEMAAVKAFVGMMPPPASPLPSVPTYQYAGATFANGDFMNLADPTPGLDLNSYNTGQSTTNSLGFSEPPLIFQGGAVSIHASVRWMTSLGRGWYSELFTFNNVPYDTSDSGYGSNHLMIYLGTGEGGSGNTPQALCFAINDYNCQNNAVDGDQHCCVANALLPDQTNEFTFEVSAAGDRKVYRDGSLLWSQTFVGQGTLPSQTYPWLRVGGSRCCTTFPGSITDIRIVVPSAPTSPPQTPPLSPPRKDGARPHHAPVRARARRGRQLAPLSLEARRPEGRSYGADSPHARFSE